MGFFRSLVLLVLLVSLDGGGCVSVDGIGWDVEPLAAPIPCSSCTSSSARRSCHRNALRSLRITWLMCRPAEKCLNGSLSKYEGREERLCRTEVEEWGWKMCRWWREAWIRESIST